MKKQILYLSILLLSILCSCEKIVKDVDIPQVDQQLVLYSFISPDETSTQVELTLSEPIFNGRVNHIQMADVTDATVVLKDASGNRTTLVYTDSVKKYTISSFAFPIIPGETYTITASAGGRTVNASCTVPLEKVEMASVKYLHTGVPSESYSGPYYRYSYEWKDVPGKANYYLATTVGILNYTSYPDTQYYYVCEGVPVSDYNHDGELNKGLCEDYNYGMSDGTTQSFDVAFFLLNTDVHYYEYHRRRIPYEEGNPFSEPYQQYSNVNGGLGVFCSYRKSKITTTVQP